MSSYKRKKEFRVYTIAALIALVAFSGIFYGAYKFFVLTMNAPDIDPATSCQRSGPRTLSVVLIDATDPFTDSQKTRLQNQIEQIRLATPRYSRLIIYAIDSSRPSGLSDVLADACNPGDPATADRMTENARLLARDYSKRFGTPVTSALDRILQSGTANSSPIIEAIEAATQPTFGRIMRDDQVTKRLYIVSDMLQHTAALSLYKTIPRIPDFQKTPEFRMHIPHLDHVDIEVWEVNRENAPNSVSRKALAQFWSDYFAAYKGQVVLWDNTII